ncbi:hypothetical protein FD729_01970 [Pantoea sp. Nvir]|uniref:hypothetical protein n=1 Tax=Pantoea sp. Nvir TaxID=2576760 RepID=UPI00135AC519|nr:hypothetical protein [Pantoea sp. Nvir]MXP66533.1 hypothetical protein [Pantoea sp. Nvir]
MFLIIIFRVHYNRPSGGSAKRSDSVVFNNALTMMNKVSQASLDALSDLSEANSELQQQIHKAIAVPQYCRLMNCSVSVFQSPTIRK